VRKDGGELVAHCRLVTDRFYRQFPVTVKGTLWGENNELLGSDSLTTSVQLLNELFVRDFALNFGKDGRLDAVKRFKIEISRGPDTGVYHGHGMWMQFAARKR
jgi:hypothetical protein